MLKKFSERHKIAILCLLWLINSIESPQSIQIGTNWASRLGHSFFWVCWGLSGEQSGARPPELLKTGSEKICSRLTLVCLYMKNSHKINNILSITYMLEFGFLFGVLVFWCQIDKKELTYFIPKSCFSS